MPVSDRFKRRTRRVLERHGRDVTVENFTDDGTTDDHGDPTRTTESTTTVRAILREPQVETQVIRGPDGQEVAVEVEIFLPDSVTVREADDADSRYATEITDSADGRTYRTLAVWDEGNGQVRVAGVTAR